MYTHLVNKCWTCHFLRVILLPLLSSIYKHAINITSYLVNINIRANSGLCEYFNTFYYLARARSPGDSSRARNAVTHHRHRSVHVRLECVGVLLQPGRTCTSSYITSSGLSLWFNLYNFVNVCGFLSTRPYNNYNYPTLNWVVPWDDVCAFVYADAYDTVRGDVVLFNQHCYPQSPIRFLLQ